MERTRRTAAVASLLLLIISTAQAVDYSPFKSLGFPNIRVWPFKQTREDIAAYLEQLRGAPFNHDHPGITEDHEIAAIAKKEERRKMRVNERRQRLGSGKALYHSACEAIRTGSVINGNLNWASLIMQPRGTSEIYPEPDGTVPAHYRPAAGDMVMTHVLCYRLAWALSPCRVVFAHWDKPLQRSRLTHGNYPESSRGSGQQGLGTSGAGSGPTRPKGLYTGIGFSTLQGHMITGEERFTVEWHAEDDSVWLDLFSLSRGSEPLGRLCMPVVRPIQRAFFRDVCEGMLRRLQPVSA
eukprot:TRINITY_DN1100_c2_g1_i1.p1 TRINITY_DN1100_c2_g1~~TRINITY_DN1100_c2_g1_i1.p1  ORF type:complete len:309 (-),score=29.94 TRINITY_DN1100_c2_g1_i1:611-1498(-)